MEVGQEEEAERCLGRALELHPGLHEAKTNLETLRARRSGKSPRANRPDPSALIAAGRFNEAEAMLLEAVAANPRDVDAWHNLGIIAANQHRELPAIERFERVVALRPEERFARRQLIRLKTGTGDLAAALCECDELARIPEERVAAVLLRAQLLQGLDRTSQAIQELQQVVQANPELDQVWFVLSEICERDGRIKESLSAAQKTLSILRKFGGHADNIAIVEDRIARLGRRLS